MDVRSLLDHRVLLVSGKGGVGKTSVAAAIGLAAAASGQRTCLVEVEGRQGFSYLLGTPPWDFTEREHRPDLFGLSIDPEASLREYLEMFYGARQLTRLVVRTPAVEFATTAAPGLKDVLLIGKVKEMERRRDPDGYFHYDLIVVDAPPTGRIINFLRAPDVAADLVNVGPVRAQAQSVVDMVTDAERTRVLLTTLLEEMPVAETLEGITALAELGVALGPLVVNRVLPRRFSEAEVDQLASWDAEDLRERLAAQAIDVSRPGAEDLRALAAGHLGRRSDQAQARARLVEATTLALVELPDIAADAFSSREVSLLSEALLDALERAEAPA